MTAPEAGTADSEAGAVDDVGELTFPLFAFLWALCAIAHHGKSNEFFQWDLNQLLSVAAISVLLKPSSTRRLLVMLVVAGVTIASDMPFISNHWMLVAAVSLGLLLCYVELWRRWRREPTPREWIRAFAPGIRICLVLTYFWAVYHKLNTTFLDPKESCAGALYQGVVDRLPFLPSVDEMDGLAIVATFVFEGGIPLLLLFRRTRLLGVIAGVGFHAMLFEHYDFSAVVIACFVPFLGPGVDEAAAKVSSAATRAAPRFVSTLHGVLAHRLLFPVLALLVLSLPLLSQTMRLDAQQTALTGLLLGGIVWAVLTGVLALALGYLLLTKQAGLLGGSVRLVPTNATTFVVVAAFAVNGAAPYLGLKSHNSFAMFSSLQTAGPYWNHVLTPRAVRVFGFEDRVVTILETTDPDLERVRKDGRELVWFEFQTMVADRAEASVTYRVNGGPQVHVARIGDVPELSKKPPLLLRRLLAFEYVYPPERNSCRD
jgi:hypothetical protein